MCTLKAGTGRAQECEECPNVKLVREVETLSVAVEPGMKDGQVRTCGSNSTQLQSRGYNSNGMTCPETLR